MKYEYRLGGLFSSDLDGAKTMQYAASISFRYGRTNYFDAAAWGSGAITLINPPAFDGTVDFGIGSTVTFYIREKGTSTWRTIWIGLVNDVNKTYDKKIAGDIVDITLSSPTGATSAFSQATYSASTNKNTSTWLQEVFPPAGAFGYVKPRGTFTTSVSVDAATQAYTTVLTYAQNTEQGYIQDNDNFCNIHGRFNYASAIGAGLRDTEPTPASGGSVYDQIGSLPQSSTFFTQVFINPEKVGQGFTFATYYAGILSLSTLDATQAQAQNTADMLAAKFNERGDVIGSVSFPMEAQINDELIQIIEVNPSSTYNQTIGQKQLLTFRGNTQQVLIEGVLFTATPAGSRLTFNISDENINKFLTLDDTYWGELDERVLA